MKIKYSINKKIKAFTDIQGLTQNNLKNLSPLLAFHWNNFDIKSILTGSFNQSSPLTVVSDPRDAEWFMLPMHWTYYLRNNKNKISEANHLADLATKHGKKIIVWFKGDLMPVVPYENAVTFLPGIVQPKAKPNQRACPVFIDDPILKFKDKQIFYRKKSDKATVGFCGYAETPLIKSLWGLIRGVQLNFQSILGKFDYDAIPIIPPTLIRARVLKLLMKQREVETNFVIRSRYFDKSNHLRAVNHSTAVHSNTSTSKDDAVQKFYNNILESDYVLCLRGYGNWSYRFYETLACGRIPVFVNTECVLPAESKIDWRQYCVWIDISEIKYIGEKIADFHNSLSPCQFIELQAACRRLWEEQLTPEGFMNHFQNYL